MASLFDSILRHAVRKAVEKQASVDSKQLPTPVIHREPSKGEKARVYQPPGTGLLFCVHGKSYFEVCSATTCRRGRKEANQRMAEFLGQ